ncbi:hypothetical protein I4U23_022080 [Adineta vaga]|nr:hypothetical protein I4U23_022080 [Adineta vaga]
MSNTTIITITVVVALDREIQLITLFNFLIQIASQSLDCILWIVGSIGSIGTCIVFYQPVFRKSPCAIYFIASSISQIFVFNSATFIRMIQYGYGVPVNSLPEWFCKTRYYIFYVFAATARYNIIFAAADRFFCSSHSVRFRRWSSPKIALYLIIIATIFWLLFYIQVLISFGVTNDKCRILVVNVMKYFSFFITAENGFFPIIPMLFFGLLTIRNIHQSKQRVSPTEILERNQILTNGRISRKDIQFHKMLANQIIIYLILNVPYPVYTIYRTYLGVSSLSGSRALIDTFMNNIFYDMIYLGYALTFINFISTSGLFRQELKQIIQRKILKRCRRHNIPTI